MNNKFHKFVFLFLQLGFIYQVRVLVQAGNIRLTKKAYFIHYLTYNILWTK